MQGQLVLDRVLAIDLHVNQLLVGKIDSLHCKLRRFPLDVQCFDVVGLAGAAFLRSERGN